MMIVGVTTRGNTAVTSVSYGGQALSFIRRDHTVWDVGTELWYLIAPAVGAHTVSVTLEGTATMSWTLSATEYWSISAVALRATPAGLFLDGFESGNTSAWSSATP